MAKIGLLVRQLTLYELAGIFMFSVLAVIFVLDANRFHEILCVGGASALWWDNLKAVYKIPLSSVFSGLFLLMTCLYIGFSHTTNIFLIRARSLIRILASYCLMMVIYKVITFYINVFNPFDRDITLQHIDRILFFGKLPSEWIAPVSNPVLTYIFFAAYMSWFTMIYVTLLLMWKHSLKACDEYVTATILAFYIGYITYTIVPAIGPEFTVHYPNTLGKIMNLLTMGQSTLPRDCFPSLHTGISIIMLIFVRRYRKEWFKFYLVITTMIIFSTQYLRVHYGIDIIAGVALGIGICQVTPYLVESWVQIRLNHRKDSSVRVPASHNTDSLSELA